MFLSNVHSENYLEDDIDDKYARLYNEIHSKQEFKCGEYSCYEKSLREGKICKQGKVIYLRYE